MCVDTVHRIKKNKSFRQDLDTDVRNRASRNNILTMCENKKKKKNQAGIIKKIVLFYYSVLRFVVARPIRGIDGRNNGYRASCKI